MSKNFIYSIFIAGGLFALQPALSHAADFDGDCCADLEERVAVLEETTARKGNRKVSLTIYGQINRALMFWDNGREDDVYSVDNDNSTSRFGLKGKAKINSDWYTGYRIEIGAHTAESDRVSESDDDGDLDHEIVIRRNEMFIGSKTYGRLTWGRAKHALEDIGKADLSGTHVISRNDGLRYIEAFALINADGTVNMTSTWDDIFPGDFQLSKQEVVRYDTPTIAGFIVSASWGEDDEYSFALRYAGEFGTFKVAARVGYGVDDEGDRREIVSSSASILHTPTGLFLTGSYGQREEDKTSIEEETYQIKTGIKQKWNTLGSTALYGEYIGTDVDDHGDGEIWGLGFVQKIDAAAMEIYAGYRHYEADLINGDNVEDFQTIVTGGRIKF